MWRVEEEMLDPEEEVGLEQGGGTEEGVAGSTGDQG